jgi:hypothetical protein
MEYVKLSHRHRVHAVMADSGSLVLIRLSSREALPQKHIQPATHSAERSSQVEALQKIEHAAFRAVRD